MACKEGCGPGGGCSGECMRKCEHSFDLVTGHCARCGAAAPTGGPVEVPDECYACGEPNEDCVYQDAAGNWVCGWCLLAHWNAALEVEGPDGMRATVKREQGGGS